MVASRFRQPGGDARIRAALVAVAALALAGAIVAWFVSRPAFDWPDARELPDLARRAREWPGAPLIALACFAIGGLLVFPVNLLIAASVVVFGPLAGVALALTGSVLSASLVHEIGALRPGSKVGVVCGSQRGVENIAEVLQLAGTSGVELVSAVASTDADLDRVDREADLVLLSREAVALGLDSRFDRPERIREWFYEFDPAGLELLRRAIARVAPREATPAPA